MGNIEQWYLGLDTNLQLYWALAIISSLFFLVQTVMTFVGIDSDMDVDTHFDGDTTDFGALSLFSVRGLINFFLGFGWSGISLWNCINNIYILYVVSIVIGVVLAYVCLFVMRKVKKLERNGAYRLADAVGKDCYVYLKIPAARSGMGKIQVSLNGSVHEIDALTDGDEIATGNAATVVSLVGSSSLLVKK